MGTLVSLIIAFLASALIIYIVGRLNLGLTVKSYGSAIIAAIVIAVVGAIVLFILDLVGINLEGGLWGAIVHLLVSAVILLISDRFLPGMTVNGFVGAIVAAIAIAVVTWIIVWLLGLIGIDIEGLTVVA